jgi:hypothetical protein
VEQIVVPSALKYVLLSGLQTAAFVAVFLVALSRIREGATAWLASAGGLLGALSSGAFAVAWAQVEWSDSFDLLDRMSENALLQHTDWAQAAAVALLAMGYIARRTQSG